MTVIPALPVFLVIPVFPVFPVCPVFPVFPVLPVLPDFPILLVFPLGRPAPTVGGRSSVDQKRRERRDFCAKRESDTAVYSRK